MTARFMNAEEKAVYAVLSKAKLLLNPSSPLYDGLNKACIARVCIKPPVPNEAELLKKAQAIIDAAG